ncbi:MAG: metallophosphoesterase [Clostridiales bacterium]|nr:metallophosphoesterase [Clostridiales bacterium]
MPAFYNAWGFIRRSAVKIGVLCEDILFFVSNGKAPKNHFARLAYPADVGTKIKIISKDESSVTIAKFGDDGKIGDGDFKILSATDFHFSTNASLNVRSCEQLCRRIEEQKPDLVVFTGDIIQGKYQQVDAVKFARMMDKTGVYWCYCFGNHETREEKGFYKWLILKSLSCGKRSLCLHGKKELFGFGNYNINIMGSDGKIKTSLFMFDSGRDIRQEYTAEYGLDKNAKGYDYLKSNQILWYEETVKTLQKDSPDLLSMMFMHIPLCEYGEIFEGDDKSGFKPSGRGKVIYGTQCEGVGSSCYNSGMFSKIKALGSTKAVFAGHDHVNDWCAVYEGVHLVYSLHGGYNPYHMGDKFNAPESEWKQGVTVTTIYPDLSFEIKPDYHRDHRKG